MLVSKETKVKHPCSQIGKFHATCIAAYSNTQAKSMALGHG